MPRSLGQALVDAGHLDSGKLQRYAADSRDDLTLIERLRADEVVPADVLVKTWGEVLGVSVVDINPYSIDPAAVEVVPEELALKYRAVALFRVAKSLTLAMADPTDIVAIDRIRAATGCEINVALADAETIDSAIRHYYTLEGPLRELVTRATADLGETEEAPESVEQSLEEIDENAAPTVRIVDLLLLQGIRSGASDIHVEPDEATLRVRYRVDGRLEEAYRLPMPLHAAVVSRLKIMADLDLAQKRVPQDGRISLKAEGRRIDLRMSSLPTVFGEKIVMRLLDKGKSMVTLDKLGLRDTLEATWRDMVQLPNGLLLVTGPTGSGKTTTLYASLAEINTLDRNIVTVEDPVEFKFPIINQVQVNVKAGMTFAAALRSILRQDPNVVMVGEIRDRETASIAIRAALTGHLVISTLHTNDAASAPTRLIDMGVEPYLVASALKGVLAQRLVRRICTRCVDDAQLDPTHYPPTVRARVARAKLALKAGKGCRHCGGTGFSGRVAIHELLEVEDEIESAIVRELPASDIVGLARRSGMKDLFDDGLAKAGAGLTSLDEILIATRTSEEEEAQPAPTPPAPDVTHAPV